MANQGCPNEGTDTRLFGKWGCWIQSRLSWNTTYEPVQLLFRWPPYVAFVLPLKPKDGKKWYFSIRAGFRWDNGWPYLDPKTGKMENGGYIFPEFIIKVMDHIVL